MTKIKYFGFDMDYTLAQYNSPDIEILAYDLIVARLIKLGYPAEFSAFKYDPSFPIRGLFYDKVNCCLLDLFLCFLPLPFLDLNLLVLLAAGQFAQS